MNELRAQQPDEFAVLAKAKLANLEEELVRLEGRKLQLEQDIERRRNQIGHLRALLDEDASNAPPQLLPVTYAPGSLADKVVQVVRDAGRPLHYREIEREMRARGFYSGGGQDPANALLAQYFDDKRLYRPQRGTYGLREWDQGAKSVGTKRIRGRTGA